MADEVIGPLDLSEAMKDIKQLIMPVERVLASGRPRDAAHMLHEAAELISGPRAVSYGPVDENHERIARLWQAWLESRREPAAKLTAHDALVMMALLKLARTQSGKNAEDNYVDAAAYAALAGEISYGGTDPD